MTGRVRFTEAAEADVDNATTWYAEKRPELSLAFLEAMNEVVERIARNPLAFPIRVSDVRQANLPRRSRLPCGSLRSLMVRSSSRRSTTGGIYASFASGSQPLSSG